MQRRPSDGAHLSGVQDGDASCADDRDRAHRQPSDRPPPSCSPVERIQQLTAAGLDGLIPLPARAEKPRLTGVTHVVDPGLTCVEADGPDGGRGQPRRRGPARLGLGDGHPGAGGQARDLPRARRRADARRDADRAGVASRADRPAARGAAAARDPPRRGLRGHARPAGRRQAAADPDARRGLHGVRRGRLQGRAARARVRAVGAPGQRGAGRRRARDRLRGPRVRRRRACTGRTARSATSWSTRWSARPGSSG